jgi:endoglucanase
VTVRNTGGSSLNPWTVAWTVPAGVTLGSGWNATVTQIGTTMTAAAPNWNPSFPPGGSVSIGFIANGPSTRHRAASALTAPACT